MACLTQPLAKNHGGGQCDVDGSHVWRHGDAKAVVGCAMDGFRHAGAFPAQQQSIRFLKGKIRIGRFCPCRQQYEAAGGTVSVEFLP